VLYIYLDYFILHSTSCGECDADVDDDDEYAEAGLTDGILATAAASAAPAVAAAVVA